MDFVRFSLLAVFVVTGIATTIVSQLLNYGGAANKWNMLIPFFNYLGMYAVKFVPMAGESKVTSFVGNNKQTGTISNEQFVVLSVVLDLSGFMLGLIGLSFAGSGLYQVIYSSVVCWSAILSRLILKKPLSAGEWFGIAIVTAGLAVNSLGDGAATNTNGDTDATVTLGVIFSLLASIVYAGQYVLAEAALRQPGALSPTQSCVQIGGTITGIISIYVLLYTLPNWSELVEAPMSAVESSIPVIVLYFGIIALSQLLHAITYFHLLGSVGAVTTGILQAIRAVGVFGLSSLLFCASDLNQCFTGVKGWSTTLVVVGVLTYSYMKSSSSRSSHSKASPRLGPAIDGV